MLHLRRSNGLASHLDRLRTRGPLTIPKVAERLGVSTSTIKAWHRAGLPVSHLANDKNIRLFEPPVPGDPGLVKPMASRLDQLTLTDHRQEVQNETHALSNNRRAYRCSVSH